MQLLNMKSLGDLSAFEVVAADSWNYRPIPIP